jgi:hypothetical protein
VGHDCENYADHDADQRDEISYAEGHFGPLSKERTVSKPRARVEMFGLVSRLDRFDAFLGIVFPTVDGPAYGIGLHQLSIVGLQH